MKKIFLFLLVAIIFNSCYTPKQAAADKKKHQQTVKHTYEFSIIQPVADLSLKFEDSIISSHFNIADNEIDFTIRNKTNHIIKLVWDNASMAVFGRSHTIIHSGIKYIDKGTSSPPSTILPNTQIDDLAVPTDNVYYREGYYGAYFSSPGSWQTSKLLLPIGKKLSISKQMIGQVITLYLPIENEKDQNIGYTFQFKVTGISGLKN